MSVKKSAVNCGCLVVGGTNLNNRCVEKTDPAEFSEAFCCFLPSFNGFDLCSGFFSVVFFRITWWPGLALKWWVNPISYRDGLYMGKFHASKEKTPVLKTDFPVMKANSDESFPRNPWKRDHFERTIVFQPLIFRGYVSCQGRSPKKIPPIQLSPLNTYQRWWFQTFVIFSPILGEDSHFDDHIFQVGWFNHQLAYQRCYKKGTPRIGRPKPEVEPRSMRRGEAVHFGLSCSSCALALSKWWLWCF